MKQSIGMEWNCAGDRSGEQKFLLFKIVFVDITMPLLKNQTQLLVLICLMFLRYTNTIMDVHG